MIIRPAHVMGALLTSALAFSAACGDDEDTTSSPSSTSTGASSSTTSGGGNGNGGSGGGGVDCAQVCSDLYDCGEENMNCMFDGTAAEKMTFVGDSMGGCIQGCEAQPALAALVDPTDCSGTIATIKGLDASFADACDNGISGSGGGGGAGGGAGGM